MRRRTWMLEIDILMPVNAGCPLELYSPSKNVTGRATQAIFRFFRPKRVMIELYSYHNGMSTFPIRV